MRVKMAINGNWVVNITADSIWSNDVEFKTREEAIAYGKENFEMLYKEKFLREFDSQDSIKTFYIAQVENHIPHVFANDVLESISSEAYDDVGEAAEDYLRYVDIKDVESLEAKLNEVMQKWMEETNNQPHFWKTTNTEEISYW